MASDEAVLVDSSAWIEALPAGGETSYRVAIDQLLRDARAATCEVVVAEVLRGIRPKDQLTILSGGLAAAAVLDMQGTGEEAGQLAWALRARGLTLPTTDLLIVAVARLHSAALLHRDKHLAEAANVLGLQVVEP
jgi:predicted nucleic acid-binding protein